jgi:hypothetical protein
MKKMTILKSIATVALLTVMGMTSFGQVLTSLPALNDITNAAQITSASPETVSANAFMPYKVVPDANIVAASGPTGIYNASGFKWTTTAGNFFLVDGTTSLTTSTAGAGYFDENTVYIKMPAAATPGVTLSVIERSKPKFDPTAGCDGNTSSLTINVVDLPTMPAATTDIGGCTATANYTLGYDFSAYTRFPVYIKYTITSYDVAGTATAGTPKVGYFQINAGTEKIVLPQSELLASLPGSPAALADGKYTVALNSIWDQASVKALNRASLIAGVTTEVTGTLSSNIIKLQTPTTAPIQHLQNLP